MEITHSDFILIRVGTSPFLEGIGSRFDFPTLVVIAGLWFIWQNYLVRLRRE